MSNGRVSIFNLPHLHRKCIVCLRPCVAQQSYPIVFRKNRNKKNKRPSLWHFTIISICSNDFNLATGIVDVFASIKV